MAHHWDHWARLAGAGVGYADKLAHFTFVVGWRGACITQPLSIWSDHGRVGGHDCRHDAAE